MKDKSFYQTIGRKGGIATLTKKGPEFYGEIGAKGAKKLYAEKGKAYFAKLGRLSGISRRKKKGLINE